MEFYTKVRRKYKPMNNNCRHWDQHQQQKVSKTFKTLNIFPNLPVPFSRGNFFTIIIKLSIAFLWISCASYLERASILCFHNTHSVLMHYFLEHVHTHRNIHSKVDQRETDNLFPIKCGPPCPRLTPPKENAWFFIVDIILLRDVWIRGTVA